MLMSVCMGKLPQKNPAMKKSNGRLFPPLARLGLKHYCSNQSLKKTELAKYKLLGNGLMLKICLARSQLNKLMSPLPRNPNTKWFPKRPLRKFSRNVLPQNLCASNGSRTSPLHRKKRTGTSTKTVVSCGVHWAFIMTMKNFSLQQTRNIMLKVKIVRLMLTILCYLTIALFKALIDVRIKFVQI
jgi:hypothetical protein